MYHLLYSKNSNVYLFYHENNLVEEVSNVDNMESCLDDWFGKHCWRAYSQKDDFGYQQWEIVSVPKVQLLK